ncbi:sugar phosphate isomerase/epimerase [Dyella sp.]|jgi:sugar phosphate isomerase/epimerase|uniref:sugar phosphate isomerase/epimerase family protein n=1 Tax=Dyella sp. TaxID=1869338 RepID=UPI002D7810E1|nr:sugar phosphate isomerase/epimerase [Dyella sp.]HET6431270.1 sugar phosphate isomerase/epimerase [Dyella sp.]
MDKSRRDFVGAGLGFGLVALVGGPALTRAAFAGRAARGAPAHFPVGVQLWSVDAQMKKDVPSALAAIRRIGYRQVEAASLHGLAPDAFRRALDEAGLVCGSAHVSMTELMKDMAGAVAQVRDLGADYLVCSAPQPDGPLPAGVAWIPAMRQAMTREAWKRNADQLNMVATKAAAAGLRVGYHNHPFEFATYDGAVGWELLIERTEPSLVSFELDCAWAAAGGRDPAAVLRQHGHRIRLLHLKDLARKPTLGTTHNDDTTCAVGSGVIDWKAVLEAAADARIVAGYVEQEPPVSAIYRDLEKSRDYLAERMGG